MVGAGAATVQSRQTITNYVLCTWPIDLLLTSKAHLYKQWYLSQVKVKITKNNHFVAKHNLILLLLCRLVKYKIDCLHWFIFLSFHKVFIFSPSVTTEGQATLFYHLLQQNYKHTHLTCVCYVLPSFAQVYWPNFTKSN